MRSEITDKNTRTVYELIDESSILINNSIIEGRFTNKLITDTPAEKVSERVAEAMVENASKNVDVGSYTTRYLKTIIEQAQELPLNAWRLFILYMGLIDPAKADVNIIRISFDEYVRYIGLDEHTRVRDIKQAAHFLVNRAYDLRTPRGYKALGLFDTAEVTDVDEYGQRYIEIKCSDAARPILFFADPRVNQSLKIRDGKLERKTIPPYTSVKTTVTKTNDVTKARFGMLMKSCKKNKASGEITMSMIELTEFLYGEKYIVTDNYGSKDSTLPWSQLRRRIKKYVEYCEQEHGLEVIFTPLDRAGTGGKFKNINFKVCDLNLTVADQTEALTSTISGSDFGENELKEYMDFDFEGYEEELEGHGSVNDPPWLMWTELVPDATEAEIEMILSAIIQVPEYKLPRPKYMSEDIHFQRYDCIRQLVAKMNVQKERGKIKYNDIDYLVGMINKLAEDD